MLRTLCGGGGVGVGVLRKTRSSLPFSRRARNSLLIQPAQPGGVPRIGKGSGGRSLTALASVPKWHRPGDRERVNCLPLSQLRTTNRSRKGFDLMRPLLHSSSSSSVGFPSSTFSQSRCALSTTAATSTSASVGRLLSRAPLSNCAAVENSNLPGRAFFSTDDTAPTASSSDLATSTAAAAAASSGPTYTSPQIVTTEDGKQYAAFLDARSYPKLKPSIVRRRLQKMRTYVGKEKNIRHSPWKLNLVCQFAAGLPLTEALTQLEFSKKWAAPLVQKVLKRTSRVADVKDGLQPSQLEVAECFATKGSHLKRIRIMGRGRMGRMEHKHSHMRVVLREIDFKLKIYQAPSANQKKRWWMMQQQAERDGARAKAERDEIERLERQAAAKAKKDE